MITLIIFPLNAFKRLKIEARINRVPCVRAHTVINFLIGYWEIEDT